MKTEDLWNEWCEIEKNNSNTDIFLKSMKAIVQNDMTLTFEDVQEFKMNFMAYLQKRANNDMKMKNLATKIVSFYNNK